MNYIVDGEKINFKSMLNNSLNNNINDENICLITNKPLEKSYIKLNCGHSFNHLPIFNEVKNQKTVKNYNEIQLLKKHQIKCPYCRKVHNELLPYYDGSITGIHKVQWVNSPENLCMFMNKCSYLFKSGKKKGLPCDKGCCLTYCKTHTKQLQKLQDKIDNKPTTKNKYNIYDEVDVDRIKNKINHNKIEGIHNKYRYYCSATLVNGNNCTCKSSWIYNAKSILNSHLPLYKYHNNGWDYHALCYIYPDFKTIIDYINDNNIWFCGRHHNKSNTFKTQLDKVTDHHPFFMKTSTDINKIKEILARYLLFIQGKE